MKYLKQIKINHVLYALVLWQTISVYLMAVGVWPTWVAWINTGLIAVFILFAEPYQSLRLVLVSIPFYVALPNRYADSLTMWRPLVAWLFVVWVTKTFNWKDIPGQLRQLHSRVFPWDKWFGLFVLVALLSAAIARYPIESLKQVIFVLNAYLLYVVAVNVLRTKRQVRGIMVASIASLGIIVVLGYIQLIVTLFTTQYYFWQYWALLISRLYYGAGLSDVLLYSNSWFSYTGGAPSLRMFSIMPDSHSFAMIAALLMAFLLAFRFKDRTAQQQIDPKRDKFFHYAGWSAIRFSGLALVFAGTRGVWVGMLVPLLLSIWFYIRKIGKPVMKKLILAFAMIVLLFALSPLFNQALNIIRVGGKIQENFLDRAASIYDLGEQSNVGRLIIWEESLVYATSHPLGVGYGNFVVSLVGDVPAGMPFEELGNIKNLRYNLPEKFVSAHSLYLNLLVEVGVIGLLLFVGGLMRYLWESWKFLKQHRNDANPYAAFVIIAAMTMLWFFAYSVFDVTIFNDKVLLYSFIVLALSGIVMRDYNDFTAESEKS